MRIFLSFVFIFLWISVPGQVTGEQVSYLTLKKVKKRFLNDPAIENAVAGIHIVDMSNGKEIICHNKEKLFIPASTMKTLYVFYALENFGNDFRWETTLIYHGKIKNSTLKGDLILRSSGDPTFGGQIDNKSYEELISGMVESLQEAGIRRITGDFVMQLPGNRYPAHGSWPIEDIGNYYGTGAWGFNFNDNMYKLYIRTGKPGEPLVPVRTEPEIPGLNIVNRGMTADPDSDDTSYLYAAPYSFTHTLIGEIPQTDSLYVIKGGIPNPPKVFSQLFISEMKQNGVELLGDNRFEFTIKPYDNEKIIWRHQSPDLLTVAKRTLDKSVNHYSEALARLVIEKNRETNFYIPKDSINRYFFLKGFRLIDLEDGSGLAPDNMIAPVEYTQFFRELVKKKGLDEILDIMPQGGKDGYAVYFLRNSPYQQNVWVKSGSVSKVRNYVGIFKAKSGKYYAFAVMVNHFRTKHKPVKKAIEKFIEGMMMKL